MTQALIAVLGIAALWLALSADPRKRRAAPWIGIIGQPAWLWATWSAGQWGIFGLTVAYTGVYLIACAVQIRAYRVWREGNA